LSGLRWRAARIWGACTSFTKILLGARPTNGVVYYPISSGWGQLYDLAILLAARLRGYKVVVHHHVYSYIDRRDWRMALLNRSLGAASVHVVHCPKMKEDYLAQYATDAEFLFLPPTIVSDDVDALPRSDHERFTLGFMSNLTRAKGLGIVLDTFTQLAESGRDVALILAGPCRRAQEQSMIHATLEKWPQRVEYRGPVFGGAKMQFFADIDVFLFPTRYKNESWGIVLTEALSTNCPVIACRRGCVPWIVRDGCGLVVDQPEAFVTAASETIARWMDDTRAYEDARQLAGRRASALSEEAHRQFAEFRTKIRQL